MKQEPHLVRIPQDRFNDYQYEVIFNAYKWDPQIEDQRTIANHVVVLDDETAFQLQKWAEDLAWETSLLEEYLINKPSLIKKLNLPNKINNVLKKNTDYQRNNHIRLLRFDFHPTTNGWQISEVNSDVPGGLAEASVLPKLAASYLNGYQNYADVGQSIVEAFLKKVKPGELIAFVYATSYSDDRQVMEFLGKYFEKHGYKTVYLAPDDILWQDKKPYCKLKNQEGLISGIVRFFPAEWLCGLPAKSQWLNYFDCSVASCNHPIAIITQAKRLPLIWDKTGLELRTWKTLLPLTAGSLTFNQTDNWILKPNLGRVGQDILIKETMALKEQKRILRNAFLFPANWVAQKRFTSLPLSTDNDELYHLCVGVFTVNAKFAGFYGRISPYPRIDSGAIDIPILISKVV